MMDLNFLDINKSSNFNLMRLSSEEKTRLEWIIQLDSKFLMNHNIMDYSFLLMIETSIDENTGKANKNNKKKKLEQVIEVESVGTARFSMGSLADSIVQPRKTMKISPEWRENAQSRNQIYAE